jgi:cytochrome c oxidase subunit II
MDPGRRTLLGAAVATWVVVVARWADAQAGEKVIQVVARKFVFIPNEITLKLGEPVVLEFTAPEVVMGFSVPALKVRTDIIPGQVARLRLVPEREGTFDFLCDVFCGDGHEGMTGRLIVVA